MEQVYRKKVEGKRENARVIALIGCQYREKEISKFKALDVYNRGISCE